MALAVGAIGQRAHSEALVSIAIFACRLPPAACCVVSGQIAAKALAAGLYQLREGRRNRQGALGIGRVGSIIGPLVGGVLAAEKCSAATVFMVAALATVWCGA